MSLARKLDPLTEMESSVLGLRGEPSGRAKVGSLLLDQASALLASDVSAAEAMQWGVDLACVHIGWPLGRVFVADVDGSTLVANGIWHDEDPGSHQPFVDAFDGVRLTPPSGLPGLVMREARPAWLEVTDERVSEEAREIARSCGLQSAFAFPIVSDRGVEGVIEVMGPKPVEVDETLLEVLGQIGLHVGRVLERERGRELGQEAERLARELAHQQSVLERIARGQPLEATLTSLCRYVERQFPGALCSILIVDRAQGQLRHGAGSSLPARFREAIEGLPVGSADPFTAALAEIAGDTDLTLWSHPLRRAGGELLGTFTICRRAPHEPGAAELRLVTHLGNLAALAIERDQNEHSLQAAANVDSLTGLPNRAYFLELLDRELDQSSGRLAVLFVGLDRFRVIADSLGHLAADRILVEVGDRLQEEGGDRCLVARFGGETFTLLVPDADGRASDVLAERVLQAIERPIELDGGEFFLTANVGIACSDSCSDAYRLVHDADAAMHAARSRGRGRHQRYDRGLRVREIERLNSEIELRRGIERGELVMHYQPILNLATRSWSGVEALVRWLHPKRGLIGPDEFIPLAEETGLIIPLGQTVLELVITQAAEWCRRLPGIHIAANASVVQLADPSIAEDLVERLERSGLSPDALRLEVTESALMEELETTQTTLEQLMAAGVRVLIDDFGTGYSSLARLGELPITGLKIDRRFSAGLGMESSARPVLHAITELARAYGLQVVAEGIEDERALADVEALGCDFAQGYHLGRPAPAELVEQRLLEPPAGVS